MLFREVESLRGQITELRNRLDAANAELCEIKAAQNREAQIKAPVGKPPIEVIEEKITADTCGDSASEYGAAAIGKIVVAAAETSERLTAGGEASPETVNSVLGKAEVAKAEVLAAVSGQEDISEKKTRIDCIVENAREYFKSIEALRI